MAEFSETIRVLVQSVFDSKGFDQLERRMATLMSARDNLQKQFDRGVGMKNIGNEVDQIKDKFTEAGLEIETFDNSIQEMFTAEDSEGKADEIIDSSAIQENVGAAKDQLQELGFAVKDIESGQVVNTGEMVSRLADADDRIQKFGGLETELPSSRPGGGTTTLRDMARGGMSLPEIRPLSAALRNTMATANVAGLQAVTGAMGDVGESANTATTGVQRFSQNSLPEMDRRLGEVAQSTRGLQMRLLGLQFTMLTVAFIFGGVMASALDWEVLSAFSPSWVRALCFCPLLEAPHQGSQVLCPLLQAG